MEITEQKRRNTGSAAEPSKKTRKLTLAACSHCRRSKRRCDGNRPSCTNCLKTKLPCQYDTDSSTESRTQSLKRRYQDSQSSEVLTRQSIDWLRSQSSAAALSCLERLRHADDPLAELCSIASNQRARQLPAQLAPEGYMFNTSPSLNNMLDFELSMSHPSSFPWLCDMPMTKLEEALPPPEASTQTSFNSPNAPFDDDNSVLLGLSTPADQDSVYYIDPRLAGLRIRFWTTVPIPDDVAAGLFSRYLFVEQPVYGFFDPDLFVQDLVTQNVRFCSPLLVNAVLFWASCSFGPSLSIASTFTEGFLESAQRLLDAEPDSKSELTVAALAILTISTICYGKDTLAKKYMAACIQMGQELHLFGIDRFNEKDLSRPPDDTSMLSHAAWGAFNLSTVYALHFHDISSTTFTKLPPLLERPGQALPINGSLSSAQSASKPSYAGRSFPYFCQFWCIVHEIAAMYYSSSRHIHEHVPLAYAESKFRQLLAWADTLPPDCSRHEGMPHNVAEMHICYHATIMDIFRPFVSQHQLLSTFSSEKRPIAIFALSFSHLKDLTRYYHSHFAGTAPSHTISWVHGPLYTATAVLRYEQHEKRAANFLYCMRSCHGLLQSHTVMKGMMKALFSMAIEAGVFAVHQANEVLDGFKSHSSDEQRPHSYNAGFVVDHDASMENRDDAVADILINKFDEMVLTKSVPVDD